MKLMRVPVCVNEQSAIFVVSRFSFFFFSFAIRDLESRDSKEGEG